MKIIVDAMGGDNAPVSNVRGALAAVRELGVEVILVGRGEDILKVLKEDGIGELPPGLEIVHASEVVEMCDNPATAFKEKKDSSLTVGLNLLKNGDGAAFVSAGSTGALLSAATLMVKRIRGIRRAALAPVVPTGGGGAVLIDCGATAEGTPEYLLQFAFMGSYYAERVLKRPEPKVGLLNIGAEPSKSELPEGADTLLPGEPLSSGGGQVEQHRAASGADQAHRLFKFVKAHASRVVVVPDTYMYHGGPCLVAAQRCLGNLLWLSRKIRVILLGGDRAGEGGGDNHLIAVIQTPGCGHAVSLFLIQVFNYHCRPHDAGAGGQAVPQPAAP